MEASELNKRVKIYRASIEAVLDTVQRMCRYRDVVQHQQLPPDCIVLSVQYNYQYNSFDFFVAHESFDVVAEGCKVPYWENAAELMVKTYNVIPYRDNDYLPATIAPEDARL